MDVQKKKIVITGASGFLGSRLYDFFSKSGFWKREAKNDYIVFAPTHAEMDITSEKNVSEYMEKIQPDVVIHSAAISNTWICQQQPQLSWNVNVAAVETMGTICHNLGCKLIFMSSDQVYNGETGLSPHQEEECLNPANIYGQHKLEAEQRLINIGADTVCLRLTWMFDHPKAGGVLNQNIIVNVFHALNKKEIIQAPVHEYRGVTYVWDVVKNMEKVFDLPAGVYNYGSECNGNTYEMIGFVLDQLGKQEQKSDFLAADQIRYAQHPRNLSMDVNKLKKYGIVFSDSYTGIRHCIQE